MGKVLVVAEKPSAAADIAKVLGCNKKQNGYIEGDQYVVTWAIGHLIGLKLPEEHDPRLKAWKLEDLPLLFDIEDSLKVLPDTQLQFQVIKKLIQSPDIDSIINAGDAGREGYLIQSWIYRMAGNRKKVKVLWASSLTEEALKKAFQDLKEDKVFHNLLQEAEARAEADYLLGMNYSRALTLLKSRDITLSYGRCQTPLLNLIVQRDQEIEKFVPETYYQLQASYDLGFRGGMIDENRNTVNFADPKCAEQVMAACMKSQSAIVKKFETQEKQKKAPLLFNLLELQKEMGRRFQYDPGKTLELTQKLYETHKMVSYPRTDSQYLSEDLLHEIKDHVNCCRFGAYEQCINRIPAEAYQKADKSYYNDKKVTDHHALIPTINANMESEYQKLSEEERNVFDAIVYRFLAIFYPAYVYSTSILVADISGYIFRSRGITVKQLGYKELLHAESEDKEQEDKIPSLQPGDILTFEKIEVLRKKTKAPARYTVETIVSLMEKHHIGTPATMASIIHKLQNPKRQCVREEKGVYTSTEFGRKFILVVPEELKSPMLTMKLEEKLKLIGEGEFSKVDFLQEIVEQIKTYISEVKTSTGQPIIEKERVDTCPYCHGNIIEERFSYSCACGFKVNRSICGKTITPKMLKDMTVKGKTGLVKGFKNKTGRTFDAVLKLQDKQVTFEFPNKIVRKYG